LDREATSALTDEIIKTLPQFGPILCSLREPLFSIHLNVDYPFNLTGICIFPKMSADLQLQKDKIQLYQKPSLCYG
jgi:HSP90 family molecular chaperone